ncbi:hypothetical protein ACKF11_13025 [Methylobacillus sp. Pita2]|uniref:hypothetical protein n=1 Tax=Methylobacillus sp. Pita2 TaxID=3383245 RepID=UPI0038B455DB
MIPYDRAFIGRDLDDFRQKFGYTVDDMCFVCGTTRNRYFTMATKEKDLPIRDASIALMCRLIDANEKLMFIPKFKSPQELLARLRNEGHTITLRDFSVLMGNNSTSANRWTTGRKRASPSVYRLAHTVYSLIDEVGVAKAMQTVRDLVLVESLNRGARDIFKDGRWVNPVIEAKRVKSKAQKAVAQKDQTEPVD